MNRSNETTSLFSLIIDEKLTNPYIYTSYIIMVYEYFGSDIYVYFELPLRLHEMKNYCKVEQ